MTINSPTEEDFFKMQEIISAHVQSSLIKCAVKYNIVDHLSKKPMDAEELALLTNTNPINMHRLLRALASIGIVKVEEFRKFSVTKFGKTLQETSDGRKSLKSIAKLMQYETIAMENLSHSIETDETAFSNIHGKEFFEFVNENSEAEQIFSMSMLEITSVTEHHIDAAYDFSKFKVIVDVGAGRGWFSRYLLSKHPNIKAVIFDEKYVIEKQKESLTSLYGKRCIPVAGNFFESVPDGGECYVLKNILHNWNDEEALKILLNIRDKMNSKTKLLIIEALIKDDNGFQMAKIRDITMMAVFGGRLRTAEEYRKLLESVGLRFNRLINTHNWMSDIIEVTKI